MFERISVTLLLLAVAAQAQERKTRIDVDRYIIDADINQRTQSLAAKAAVRFTPLDDSTSSASFELNNALNVSKVLDEQNREIPSSRSQQDFTVHLNFNQPLEKGSKRVSRLQSRSITTAGSPARRIRRSTESSSARFRTISPTSCIQRDGSRSADIPPTGIRPSST